ncbi:MAG: ankyrin repeat domain-containing protein [Verrucomicrobiaceae bacterium]|nr:MAG: ankyrin repeat domain-containing protein [Verrucomicrobiaceae bacterium]
MSKLSRYSQMRLITLLTTLVVLAPGVCTAQGKRTKPLKQRLAESRQLHSAFQRGDRDTILRIVRRGVPIDMPMVIGDSELQGFSMLSRAVIRKDMAMVRFLVRNGASLSARTSVSSTPLEYAMGSRDPDLVEFCLNHPKVTKSVIDRHSLLHQAVLADDVKTADLLIAQGANVNMLGGSDTDGLYTPLHYAASLNKGGMIRHLVAVGAQVNSRDTHQRTPLFRAVEVGSIESVIALVECGANVNAHDANDESVLSMQDSDSRRNPDHYKRCVEYLRSKGARK